VLDRNESTCEREERRVKLNSVFDSEDSSRNRRYDTAGRQMILRDVEDT